MFTVPAAIRRVSGPPPVEAPIFTPPVTIPAQTVDTAFSWDMSQYFSGDPVVSYALTNDGGQAWLSINTSTGELSGQTPATPVSVTGVNVTATNAGGSTPTGDFGFEVEDAQTGTTDFVQVFNIASDGETLTLATTTYVAADYDAMIDWGDGNVLPITAWNVGNTHVYTTAGEYTVSISGKFTAISWTDGIDKDKLLRVTNLGHCQWSSLYRAFRRCTNLIEFTTGDTDAVNTATDMTGFLDYHVDPNIVVDFSGNWDTTGAVNFLQMFRGIDDTNMDISGFNISSVTNCTSILQYADWSTAMYDKMLIAWAAQDPNIQPNVTFTAELVKYTAGGEAEAARLVLSSAPHSWVILDGGPV